MLLDILISWDMDQIYMNRVKNISKTFSKSFIKNQSAMEYLMTYGWSILIIAVVLGALSFLGVFNPVTFAPKATAGGCQVVKNSELGISNLEGSCNNQMPQYVAQFDGQSSYIYGDGNYSFPLSNFQWIYPVNFGSSNFQVVSEFDGNQLTCGASSPYCGALQLALTTTGNVVVWNGGSDFVSNFQISLNRWSFIGFSINYTSISIYTNGEKQLFQVSTPSPANGAPIFTIFGDQAQYQDRDFKGMIANVQTYNGTVSSSTVNTLYSEGIGGVPTSTRNLVGWWPLNGNANDYSGNQNNGVPTNVVFTSNWYGGYTQP
jgi:hypothetical protein